MLPRHIECHLQFFQTLLNINNGETKDYVFNVEISSAPIINLATIFHNLKLHRKTFMNRTRVNQLELVVKYLKYFISIFDDCVIRLKYLIDVIDVVAILRLSEIYIMIL